MGGVEGFLLGKLEPTVRDHSGGARILIAILESGRLTVSGGQFDWGGRLLKGNGGVYKGWLGPDGNRADSANAQASFTERPISRSVSKEEVSEPTIARRSVEDHQIKVTLGITG